MTHYRNRLTHVAQKLRREMTPMEKHLWYDFLKPSKVGARRQAMFDPYIVDFFIPSARLIVELDGSQHYEGDGKAEDEQRDAYLREMGMEIVRYSNLEVTRNFQGVCQDLERRITEGQIKNVDYKKRIKD